MKTRLDRMKEHFLAVTLVVSLPGLLDSRGKEVKESIDEFDSVHGCLSAGKRWAATASRNWHIKPDNRDGWLYHYYCTELIGENSVFYAAWLSPADLQKALKQRAEIRKSLGLPADEWM